MKQNTEKSTEQVLYEEKNDLQLTAGELNRLGTNDYDYDDETVTKLFKGGKPTKAGKAYVKTLIDKGLATIKNGKVIMTEKFDTGANKNNYVKEMALQTGNWKELDYNSDDSSK